MVIERPGGMRTSLHQAMDAAAGRAKRAIDDVLERHRPDAGVPSWESPLAGVTAEAAVDGHAVWAEIAPRHGRPGFVRGEFKNPDGMDVYFLRLLWLIRTDVHMAHAAGALERDVPMRLISDARTSGGASLSAHFERPARAVDLQVYNAYERSVLVTAAVRRGIVRIGVYPGKDRRKEEGWPSWANDSAGLHLDATARPQNPSPRCWTKY